MADLPRLALRVHGGMAPRFCVEQATAADASGYATLWFAENPFQRGVLPAMAACAMATRRLRLGIGVFNPYNRHPTLIAMEAAALDELSEGRVVLGIGSGLGAKVVQMGLAYDRPIGAVRDAVAIVRGMLRGEEVRYAGRVFSADGARLEFPVRRPDMPILVAAMGDQAIRLASEVGDGLMISNMCPPAYTARALRLARERAEDGPERAGARAFPFEVIQYVPCAIRDDASEARRLAKIALGGMLPAYWRLGSVSPVIQSAMADHSGIEPARFRALVDRLAAGEPAVDVLDERLVDAYAVAGTAEDCVRRCARYAEAGVTELGVWFLGDRVAEDVTRFGRAVAAAWR